MDTHPSVAVNSERTLETIRNPRCQVDIYADASASEATSNRVATAAVTMDDSDFLSSSVHSRGWVEGYLVV